MEKEPYVVFTEIHDEIGMSRWYYGTWPSEEEANEVAYRLGHNPAEHYWRCICPKSQAREWGIRNLPEGF